MEIIILGILSFVISYYLQAVCVKAMRKMIKFIPLICYIVFAILCAVLIHMAYQGELYGGGNIFEYYLGPIVLQLFCIIILVASAIGILAAWIVHVIEIRKKDKG